MDEHVALARTLAAIPPQLPERLRRLALKAQW